MANKIEVELSNLEKQGLILGELADRTEQQANDMKKNIVLMESSLKCINFCMSHHSSQMNNQTWKLASTLRFGSNIVKSCVEAYKAADSGMANQININPDLISITPVRPPVITPSPIDIHIPDGTLPSPSTVLNEEMAKRSLQQKYDTLKQQRLNKKKDPSYKDRCGALAADQLKYEGLIKNYGANGNDFARGLIKKGTTDTGATVTGYNTFDDLLNNAKQPITNVAVSYDYGGWVTSKEYGHVMVISRIENGKVYFMDNRKSMSVRTGDKHLEMQCMSIEDFKKDYFGPKMRPNAIAHIQK